jgi:hypothetical protein
VVFFSGCFCSFSLKKCQTIPPGTMQKMFHTFGLGGLGEATPCSVGLVRSLLKHTLASLDPRFRLWTSEP